MPNISAASGSKKVELPSPTDKEKSPPISQSRGCDDVLNLCRKAVDSQIKLNHAQQKQIDAQEDLLKTQRQKIDQLEKENNSILKSPWLWIGVGLIGGQLLLNGTKR